MKKEEMIDFHIRNVWQKIARMYNAEGSKVGLSMSWGFVLLNIDNKQGTPSTKLGPIMGMESTSLTRILKAMEQKGLITRKTDPWDKRMVRLFLTQEGLKAREYAKKNVLQFNEYLYKEFPAHKIETFIELMSQLNTILNSRTIFETELIH